MLVEVGVSVATRDSDPPPNLKPDPQTVEKGVSIAIRYSCAGMELQGVAALLMVHWPQILMERELAPTLVPPEGVPLLFDPRGEPV